MSDSGYNSDGAAINFNQRPDMLANPYGYIKGVGCAGTNSGVDASKSIYVEPPLTNAPLTNAPLVGGGNGYSFTNERVPIAGPGAPYSVIEPYNTSNTNYRTDFPKSFPSLVGGSKRRRHSRRHSLSRRHSRKYRQYGCSKKTKCGGKKRNTSKCGGKRRKTSKRRTRKSRGGFGTLTLARRGGVRKTMRGGMSSEADFTAGRNTSQDIPYGNKAYTIGQGLGSMLGSGESALASPPPFLPYDDCGKYTRN